MTINRKLVHPLAAAALLLISGCSSAGTTAAPTSAAPTSMASMSMGTPPDTPSASGSAGAASTGSDNSMATMIHIQGFSYRGPDSVSAGSSVSVMNMDAEAHTITADDGSFDVTVPPGATASFTAPAPPGTYKYHCAFHGTMHGTLTVK